MRTTLNINDDLMAQLKKRADINKKSLTALINELLRNSLFPKAKHEAPFHQKTFPLGTHPGIKLHKALDIAAEMESEYSINKMEIGK